MSTMQDYIWEPTVKHMHNSRVIEFMESVGIKTCDVTCPLRLVQKGS